MPKHVCHVLREQEKLQRSESTKTLGLKAELGH